MASAAKLSRRGVVMAALCAPLAARAAAPPAFRFASIDGGEIALADYAGRPILVVNTASQCGFTAQYADLQKLHEKYGPRGLLVLAVPSDDFRQELDTAEAVQEFCETTFGLTLPMTDITRVTGPGAHPFYRWLDERYGIRPRWNFSKVLIGPDGAVAGDWGSFTKPLSGKITRPIEAMLGG